MYVSTTQESCPLCLAYPPNTQDIPAVAAYSLSSPPFKPLNPLNQQPDTNRPYNGTQHYRPRDYQKELRGCCCCCFRAPFLLLLLLGRAPEDPMAFCDGGD